MSVCLWLEEQQAFDPPVPRFSLCPMHTRQDRPHCEPNAHLAVFAAVLGTSTKHKLLEEASNHIHDCKSGCDADECKREFLRLEQLVDPRQGLVNVNLVPVSSCSPSETSYSPLLFVFAQTMTLIKCQLWQTSRAV